MIVNVLKYTLGILLAIAILAGSGFATALYFMNRTSAPPTKPIFANDSPSVKGQKPKVPVAKATKAASKPEAKGEASPKPTPTPTTSPKATESPKPLPPGAYQARVTWNQGLIVRAEPNQDAERIGGVGFNSRVIVLQQSEDNTWQKIRLEDGESQQEGWVKAGNTQKVDQEDLQQTEQPEQINQ
ncbi:SH3 domain-containing protein [Mastigocladopsis repens]|uniref:SH3 domain-containing protein n=1 Tax=Mastigocladopsis repens TaxID=221287 RepID=UPI000474A033|nr:SH3 domain-containing protein [Mastigocladopsis repens]